MPGSLRANLRAIATEGAAFSVMVGIGETFLPAFVLAIGMTEVASGLISTVPILAGGALQLISPLAVRVLDSNRRWVVLCALAQALSFIPLIVAAFRGTIATSVVFLVAAVYWGSGMGTGPAWNTWMQAVIPRSIRPRYFASRTRLGQAAVLAGFLVGGLILQAGSLLGVRLWAFGVIFSIAALARCYSALLHAGQAEPIRPAALDRRLSLGQVAGLFRGTRVGRLLGYLLVMQMAVNISGPYFNAYMLVELELSYFRYILLIAAAFVARIATLPLHGWLAKRFSAHTLLWVGGLGIVPTSSMWLYSDNYGYLVFVQALGGVMWAAYELAIFLLFFEAIRPEERTSVLTAYNFANSLALVVGAVTGGAILRLLGARPTAYLALFAISSLVRLSAVLLLARVQRSDAPRSAEQPRPATWTQVARSGPLKAAS